MRSVRVIADAGNKELRTVNIVTSQAGHTFETCTQVSGDKGREIETVQVAGSASPELPTLCIPSYTGPA